MSVVRVMEVSRPCVSLKSAMIPGVPGSPVGLKEPRPENGLLALPASICASGSWIVPAHAGAVSHASIPHVATKRLTNIECFSARAPRPLIHGDVAGGASQLKVSSSIDKTKAPPVLEPKAHLDAFLVNSCNNCANSGVLRRLASSGSLLISSRE